MSIRPLISVATICLLPAALQAQTSGASQPSAPSQSSTSSVPSTPSLPTSPSQPAGSPYAAPTPYGGFQPAGTQQSTVSGDTSPAFQLRAMAAIEHESNALRAPSGGISDTAFIAGVGLRADRRYGLQRFRADVEANAYRYDKQSDLNYSVLNYALAWDWAVGTRLHGVLSANQNQYQEVTTDPVSFLNRVGRRTERSEVADAIYDLGARVRLLAGAVHTQASSTEPNSWDASPSVTSARLGVGYELASGSSLWARYRRGDGHYTDSSPGASKGDFKENETEVALKWPVSAKTNVEAHIGRLERKHDTGTYRDFSGTVGGASVYWDITGKTRLIAGYSRDLSATGLATGGSVVGDRFYIGPVWKVTPQIAVNARYDRVNRDWKGVPAGTPEFGRNETIETLSAGVEWEPRRWLAVSTYVRGEKQKSNINTGYRNTTIGAAVKAYF